MVDEGFHMRRVIGLGSVVAINISLIIGSGIFISPSSIVANTGSVGLALIMWVVPAILSLLVALCFMELASIFPASGGEYKYFRNIYGPVVGFMCAWIVGFIILPLGLAINSQTASKYILSPLFQSCDIPDRAVKSLSICLIGFSLVVNALYVKLLTKVQQLFSALKVIALAFIIIVGMVQLIQGRTSVLSTGFEGSKTQPGSLAVATQVGIFLYVGWNSIFMVVEEVENPRRNIPLGLGLSILLVTLLYVLSNVAYFTVIDPQDMMHSQAVVTTYVERTLGPTAALLAPLYVGVMVVGTLLACLLTTSRLVFAAAQDQLFPPIMAAIHMKYRTPWVAIAVVTSLGVLFTVSDEVYGLIEMQGIVYTLDFMGVASSVLYLRWTRRRGAMQVPLFVPIIALALTLGLYILGVYQKPWQNLVAIILIAAGIPIYIILVIWCAKLRALEKWHSMVTCSIQKTLRVAPTDKGNTHQW